MSEEEQENLEAYCPRCDWEGPAQEPFQSGWGCMGRCPRCGEDLIPNPYLDDEV